MRSEWGDSGTTNRQQTTDRPQGRKQEGFKKREKRVAREVGELFTEVASQEPRAETVLRKKKKSTRNGVVT